MRKYFSVLVLIFLFSTSQAQYKVRFVLREKSAIRHDSIFITGTFCNWDSSANPTYLLWPTGKNERSIELVLPKGVSRYKFHRGSWLTVEKRYNGDEVPDRVITITSDSVFKDSVLAWRDQLITDKKYALLHTNEDTSRLNILAGLAMNYAFWTEYYNADSALFYANEALQLQQKIIRSGEYKSWVGERQAYFLINLQEITASLFHALGNYPKALEIRLENLKLAEKAKDKFLIVNAIRSITNDYASMNDYENMLRYGNLMDSILNTLTYSDNWSRYNQGGAKYIIANAFYRLNKIDSALAYANSASGFRTNFPNLDTAFNSLLLGNIYAKKNDEKTALYHYNLVLSKSFIFYNPQLAAGAYEGMAKLYKKRGRIDSALYAAKQAMALLQNNKSTVQSWGENTDSYIAEISPLVAELYKANNQPDSAYKYLLLSVSLKDSLYNVDKVRQFQTLSFNEMTRRQQLEQQGKDARRQYRNRIKIYGLIGIITGFIVLALVLYRNNKQKQKANSLLQQQKQEIERTLDELKATQQQLIQSEKMASLGELTAGIAHEIQNPLNFVNNFSEVNKELVDELQQELRAGKTENAIEIADNIKANEEKINHHGKRADAIVKGMLQHSRSSSGQKESTDINALCDEYLRLAYHGLRAKDKSFNAGMIKEFDESLEKVKIIPQDIGRVILNLINNAFYAVSTAASAKADSGYEPTVTVTTKKAGKKVLISVKDNGNGIPDAIKEKIFQPFFTTKPTGQGTGLGLSLSYDIVKAHGGELSVESEEGEGSVFTIQLQ